MSFIPLVNPQRGCAWGRRKSNGRDYVVDARLVVQIPCWCELHNSAEERKKDLVEAGELTKRWSHYKCLDAELDTLHCSHYLYHMVNL